MNKIISVAALFILMGVVPGICGEMKIFSSVEALAIQCQGYTLCAPLSKEQRAYASKNMEEANSSKVYRFRDNNLNIVADQKTHRVLVMFEQFEKVGQQKVQDLVGDLFIDYGDPTVSAHDKVVYWAWGKKKSSQQTNTRLPEKRKNSLKFSPR